MANPLSPMAQQGGPGNHGGNDLAHAARPGSTPGIEYERTTRRHLVDDR